MLTAVIVFVVAVAVAMGALAIVVMRAQRASSTEQARALRETFESLQRNLLVMSQESQRALDAKASLLRTELGEALQNTRLELGQGMAQTTQLLEQKVGGIDSRLDARLGELSKGVQDKLEKNLKEGFTHFERVQEHLKFAGQQLQNLSFVGQSINDLNNLLRLPHLRGNFGEATLERLLSDLLPVSGFELQYRVVPNSMERVDAVIKYPKQVLPIDSKFPREQVLPLFETQDPAKLDAARTSLGEVMKNLARQIREKYIHPEHGTTDMALLFVPSETLYFEMLRNVKLSETLGKLRVFAVSPNTLAVTLHAISIARDYYEMAKGVEKTIAEVKRAQKHFENFEQRFEDVGKHLKRSSEAFDTAATHLDRYNGAVQRLSGVEGIPLPADGGPQPPGLTQ